MEVVVDTGGNIRNNKFFEFLAHYIKRQRIKTGGNRRYRYRHQLLFGLFRTTNLYRS